MSKLDAPEFLLFMVVTFMLWSVGLVDLLAHTANDPASAVIGPYTRAMATILVAYGLLFIVWLAVLLFPRSHLYAVHILTRIQSRWWLATSLLLVFVIIGWTIFTWSQWQAFPGLRTAVFFWMLLVSAVLILSGWRKQINFQPWRRFILIPVVCVLLLEGTLQLLLFTNQLPASAYFNFGLFAPYGRIFQNREGITYATTNNFGWYYPDFELNKERTVLLLGDTFVQALQISPEQHMGVHLQSLISDSEEGDTEVIALGMPGFGPGLYLSITRLVDMVNQFDPDEVVLLFHLSDDIQVVDNPVGYDLYFILDENGDPQIHVDQVKAVHELKHYILSGYSNDIDPLKTIRSHFLTSKVFSLQTAYAGAQVSSSDMDMPSTRGTVVDYEVRSPKFTEIQRTGLASTPGASNFIFESEQSEAAYNAMQIAIGHIRLAREYLASRGVSLRLVTIPAFPQAFFTQDPKERWSAQMAGYDLLLPENSLTEFARGQGIPFVAMGRYLQQHMTVGEIDSLYFEQGQGHFTPAGHQYFAQAIYDCFYSQPQSEVADNPCTH